MIKQFIRRMLGVGQKTDNTQPKLLTQKEHGINAQLVSPNAVRVTQALQDEGFKAFVVGGAVRDLLVGIRPKDFDIATNATPDQVKRLFRRAFIIGRRFQIVHVMFGQDLLEVTTFRGPSLEEAQKDEHGRVLRDNNFGEQHEDAIRRDFTINAMYYDPATQTVLDYHGGMDDIRAKKLRIIGAPEERFREDPVRMLRAVRLAAKLGFTIEPQTAAHIPIMAPLIDNVPAARVFDEMLKLLMSGSAMACLQELRKAGLHHGLLPLLDVVMEQPLGEKFVNLSLANTDSRIREGKGVSPGFLFAALLWHQVLEKWKAYQVAGEYPIPALHLAADDVLNTQTDTLALQRKIASDMRDIWAMQPRFERRTGKSPYKLLEHPRMRAGYDFLLLRCASGEIDAEIGDWWTSFMEADGAGREALLQAKPQGGASSKRPRRRSSRSERPGGDDSVAGSTGEPRLPSEPQSTDAKAVAGDEPKPRRRRSRTPKAKVAGSDDAA